MFVEGTLLLRSDLLEVLLPLGLEELVNLTGDIRLGLG